MCGRLDFLGGAGSERPSIKTVPRPDTPRAPASSLPTGHLSRVQARKNSGRPLAGSCQRQSTACPTLGDAGGDRRSQNASGSSPPDVAKQNEAALAGAINRPNYGLGIPSCALGHGWPLGCNHFESIEHDDQNAHDDRSHTKGGYARLLLACVIFATLGNFFRTATVRRELTASMSRIYDNTRGGVS
jgi:hypothetical protein